MKYITLVRHVKSSWGDPALSDHDRPLNRRGKRDAPIMGQRIKDHGIRPSLVVTSPAKRARNTARIIADQIGYPREFLQREDDIYLASLQRLLAVIASQDGGFNNILLVGHNPGLTDLANYFVPNITGNLPTAGVVSVELDTDSWDLRPCPAVRLIAFDYPKLGE